MRRRAALAAGAAALASGAAFTADRPGPARRLGALLLDGESSWTFFRRDLAPVLAELGWHEGRNLRSDWRFADGDPSRLAALAEALLREGADVLLTRGTPATRALQRATSRVPIVTGVGDPLGAGFAASLAAPGGNVTGLSYAVVEAITKQVELLREMVPGAARLLVLVQASRAPSSAEPLAIVERVARAQSLVPQVVAAERLDDLRQAVRAARERHAPGALAAFSFSFGAAILPEALAPALLQERVPAVFDQRGYVEAGGLMSYRLNWEDQTRRTAVQLDKVLRGENPAGIPFELPTRSELVVNARTARALGLVIPRALRVRADEVIE
jgi:putative ABC transport system substrate-binding protein